MRDEKVSLPRILTLHPVVLQDVLSGIEEAERQFPSTVMVRIVQATRTFPEQAELFALGRTKKGDIVTNAKAGQSPHNYGLAFDFALFYFIDFKWQLSWDIVKDFDRDKVSDWLEVVNVFKAKGWNWGGDFKKLKDSPHLEKMFGLSWEILLDRYNKKMWLDVQKYVKI